MGDVFSGLTSLTIASHGDARERDVWTDVAGTLSNYEAFWRELIVLLTNRIVPGTGGPDWIRLRSTIPPAYEQLAMHNYSLFYSAATARRAIDDDRRQLGAGAYPHPERIFAAMQACVEQAKPLVALARQVLRDIGIDRPKLPKHPQDLYETIGAYRNAFSHDPVLGRAVDQGRELLPPLHRLPKDKNPLLWRDAAAIPITEMIDGLVLEEDLYLQLSGFLQAVWASLAKLFIEARQHKQFIDDLGLKTLLPIRCAPALSLAGPIGASGSVVVARSDTH